MSAGLLVPVAVFLLVYGSVALFARRHPLLGRLALREAIRRRGQSVLVIAGLMVGTATITGALVGADSVTDSAVDAFAYRNWGHIDVTVTARNRFFDAAIVGRLGSSDELQRLTDGIAGGVELVGAAADLDVRQGSSRVTLVGFDAAHQDAFGRFVTADGRQSDGSDLADDEAFVSRVLADKIDAAPGHRLRMTLDVEGRPHVLMLRVRDVVRSEGPGAYTLGPTVFARLDGVQRALRTERINVVRLSALGAVRGSEEAGDAVTTAARRLLEPVRTPPLDVRNAKRAEVDDAVRFTSFIRAMLIGMSSLVVAAGAALIVNLVGMLAEERRSRLGVLRALGLTRRRLVGLSVTEGALYSLVAGAVGVGVGTVIGRIVAERFGRAFVQFAGEDFDFEFFFSLRPETLLVGFAAGSVLTLGVIFFASRRTARMTITAAIRDLPEPAPTRTGRRGWRIARAVALSLVGVAGITSGQSFLRIIGGIAVLFVLSGLVKHRLSTRVHASAFGIALAGWAFFAIAQENPDEDAGAFFATFVASMLSAVFGFTTLVAAHLSLVERLVGILGRGSSRLRAVLRPPLAFLARRPMRTGLTTGVFAVIISMLTLFAVFTVIFRSSYQEYGNGFDVRVLSTASADIEVPAAVRGDVERSELIPTRGYIGPMSTTGGFGDSQRVFVPLFLAADPFADDAPVRLEQRSDRYGSDAAAWAAVLRDPTLIVTNFAAPDQKVTLHGRDGPVTFTSVGHQPFGLLDGVFASARALEPFRDAPLGAVMLLDVRDVGRARTVARTVESSLFERGVDAEPVAKLLDDADRANRTFFSTIDILMRMGLVVGILALGIVALRIVIERRHIIGVLRALGYRRRSVMGGLIAEALVTVTIGSLVGSLVGVVMGWVFWLQQESRPSFGLDGAQLGGVLALVIGAVVLVTIGPAWRASRLPPAEAVRYSE